MHNHEKSNRFGPKLRLRTAPEFEAVRAERVREKTGPLLVWARPNGLDHARIGFALGRRVGGAVQRNRIRRRLREAFRLDRHGWPGAYDVVITADRHAPLGLEEYRRLLDGAVRRLHRRWTRKLETRRPDA